MQLKIKVMSKSGGAGHCVRAPLIMCTGRVFHTTCLLQTTPSQGHGQLENVVDTRTVHGNSVHMWINADGDLSGMAVGGTVVSRSSTSQSAYRLKRSARWRQSTMPSRRSGGLSRPRLERPGHLPDILEPRRVWPGSRENMESTWSRLPWTLCQCRLLCRQISRRRGYGGLPVGLPLT